MANDYEHEPGQYCIDCRYWEMSPYDDPCDACIELYEEGGPLRALWEPKPITDIDTGGN